MTDRFLLALASAVVCLAGCATGSIRMIGQVATYTSGTCQVTVYQTKEEAANAGIRREICVVEGSSAFSFDHSIEGAIKNNINKICQCGANKAYVISAHTESEMGIKGVSYVNMVGFQ